MMIVLSYDVDTTDAAGAKRLRKVAKICESRGCRVQNSVFELLVDPAQLVALKAQLRPRIEFMGRGLRYEQDDVIIL